MAYSTLVAPSQTVGGVASSTGFEELVSAPYALVRTTALALPHDGNSAARHRELCERLVAALHTGIVLTEPLTEALYHCAANEAPEFRRRVVLPLRRDVHNMRSPRPSVYAALGDLPRRIAPLRQWLAARNDVDALTDAIATDLADALADDRRALAALCRDDALRCAVTLSGVDLLRAIDRAAARGCDTDSRTRKSEPAVLRHAMRAATRTAPLTWFSHVTWGRWTADPVDEAVTPVTPGRPTGHPEPDRRLVAEMLHGVLTEPAARHHAPHHLAADVRICNDAVVFRRARPGHDYTGGATDEVRLPHTAPMRYVLHRVATAGSLSPTTLAREIASRLPVTGSDVDGAGRAFVQRLVDHGLLIPDLPIAPHDPEPLAALARVLAEAGKGAAAERIHRIDVITRGFADLTASQRVTAVASLAEHWAAALAEVGVTGRPTRSSLTEDVTTGRVLPLGPSAGAGSVPALTHLTPLFEALDLCTVFNAAVHDRFVDRHGAGGRCSIAAVADDLGDIWRQAALVGPDGLIREDPAPTGLPVGPRVRAVAELRRRLAVAATGIVADNGEVVLPDHLVDTAAAGRPGWVVARPASYSVFALPMARATSPDAGLCVNRVYGGWGRFTSRFLRRLPPQAAEEVTAQLNRALPRDGRAAQVRPVAGFNANLHPLLVPEEIADEPGPGTLHPRELDVVHDLATDRVRVRHTATGELLDVLYLGFLVPVALPIHLGPLLNDLSSGLVNVAATLAPGSWIETRVGRVHERPRVRWREVVLSRRRWRLPSAVADLLRAELLARPDNPAAVMGRWRAALGLPADVFVAGVPGDSAAGSALELDSLQDYLGRPRSQYVDLGSALHLHCLARTLAAHVGDLVIEEALPSPTPGNPVTELVIETYRSAS